MGDVINAFGDAAVCSWEVEFCAVDGENTVELEVDSWGSTYVAFPLLGSCKHAALEPIIFLARARTGLHRIC